MLTFFTIFFSIWLGVPAVLILADWAADKWL